MVVVGGGRAAAARARVRLVPRASGRPQAPEVDAGGGRARTARAGRFPDSVATSVSPGHRNAQAAHIPWPVRPGPVLVSDITQIQFRFVITLSYVIITIRFVCRLWRRFLDLILDLL